MRGASCARYSQCRRLRLIDFLPSSSVVTRVCDEFAVCRRSRATQKVRRPSDAAACSLSLSLSASAVEMRAHMRAHVFTRSRPRRPAATKQRQSLLTDKETNTARVQVQKDSKRQLYLSRISRTKHNSDGFESKLYIYIYISRQARDPRYRVHECSINTYLEIPPQCIVKN